MKNKASNINTISDNPYFKIIDMSWRHALKIKRATPEEYNDSKKRLRNELIAINSQKTKRRNRLHIKIGKKTY